MKLDYYSLYAKYAPAAITMIPLILFHHFYVNEEFLSFTSTIWQLRLVSTLSMSVVFTITFIEASRAVSKILFEYPYFRGKQHLPTTHLLMHSDQRISQELKGRIHKRIHRDFKILLHNPEEELNNPSEARRLIAEAVTFMLEKVRRRKLLSQYNMQYGFVRNLIGGSLVAFFISLFDVYFFSHIFPHKLALVLAIVLCIMYSLPVILSRPLLRYYGYQYADRLVTEYITVR